MPAFAISLKRAQPSRHFRHDIHGGFTPLSFRHEKCRAPRLVDTHTRRPAIISPTMPHGAWRGVRRDRIHTTRISPRHHVACHHGDATPISPRISRAITASGGRAARSCQQPPPADDGPAYFGLLRARRRRDGRYFLDTAHMSRSPDIITAVIYAAAEFSLRGSAGARARLLADDLFPAN